MRSTTVTTAPSGSLHPRSTQEVCRRASRTHRPSNPHHCLPVRLVPTVIVDYSLNQLNPRAIYGEMTTPSGAEAWTMRSTGTETDSVFVHAASHFGPCPRQPLEDEPRRIDWRHQTIAANRSPAPPTVGSTMSGQPPVSHSLGANPFQRTVDDSPAIHPHCVAAPVPGHLHTRSPFPRTFVELLSRHQTLPAARSGFDNWRVALQ